MSDAEGRSKYTVEHAKSSKALCQSAPCKRTGIAFQWRELRLGTWNDRFENYTWKHWGCATDYQMRDIASITVGDCTKVGGFEKLSALAQQRVRDDLKAGEVLDKDFKGFPEAFALSDAFSVEHAKSNRAVCHAHDCGEKIGKGEIRMGTMEQSYNDQGNRVSLTSWQWYHWRCVTADNMASLRSKLADDVENLDGLELIDPSSQEKVREAFAAGEVLDKDWTGVPEKVEKPKVARKKRAKKGGDDAELEPKDPFALQKGARLPWEADSQDETERKKRHAKRPKIVEIEVPDSILSALATLRSEKPLMHAVGNESK